MHKSVQNLIEIEKEIKLNLSNLNINNLPKIIAVSKTFKIDKILPLINYGHIDFGENKVQEAIDKWTEVKLKNPNIKFRLLNRVNSDGRSNSLYQGTAWKDYDWNALTEEQKNNPNLKLSDIPLVKPNPNYDPERPYGNPF